MENAYGNWNHSGPSGNETMALRVEKLVASAGSAKTVADEVQTLAGELKRLKEAVSIQITNFDESLAQREMSLEAMISLCEQMVEREESLRERKRQLEQSLSDAGIRLKRARDELKSIEKEQLTWLREWGQAIEGLGLKADVHPEHATETFDHLVAFFDKFDKSEELRKRIYGLDQVEERFNKEVFEFADGIGFKRDGQEAATITTSELNDA